MLVAGMRMGEQRGAAQAQAAQQQQAQQQQMQQQQQQIQQQQQQLQQQQHQQAAPAPASAPTKDPIAELQKLSDLHKAGALTDAEFAAAKQKLLSS